MPKSRNRKKHKSALAKRNKAIKLKKELAHKKILKWMAQMDEARKLAENGPIGPQLQPVVPVEDAQIVSETSQDNGETQNTSEEQQ